MPIAIDRASVSDVAVIGSMWFVHTKMKMNDGREETKLYITHSSWYPMLSEPDKNEIRALLRAGWKKSEIAWRMSVSMFVIQKAVAGEDEFVIRRAARSAKHA